jgi:hypothetical protein
MLLQGYLVLKNIFLKMHFKVVEKLMKFNCIINNNIYHINLLDPSAGLEEIQACESAFRTWFCRSSRLGLHPTCWGWNALAGDPLAWVCSQACESSPSTGCLHPHHTPPKFTNLILINLIIFMILIIILNLFDLRFL